MKIKLVKQVSFSEKYTLRNLLNFFSLVMEVLVKMAYLILEK